MIHAGLPEGHDLLVGLLRKKRGTNTGVAERNVAEQIEQFVAAGKPALLYFSDLPVHEELIDTKQTNSLTELSSATRQKARVANIGGVEELQELVIHDLMALARTLKSPNADASGDEIDQTASTTVFIPVQRRCGVTGEPEQPYPVGPDGYRLGFTEDGDMVELIPDDLNPEEESTRLLQSGKMPPSGLLTKGERFTR